MKKLDLETGQVAFRHIYCGGGDLASAGKQTEQRKPAYRPLSGSRSVITVAPWERARARRYSPGHGLGAKAEAYHCPKACYAGSLAALYDDLPWTYTLSLSAAPGTFSEAWNAWWPLASTHWEGETYDPAHPGREGFWLQTFAYQASCSPAERVRRGPLPPLVPLPYCPVLGDRPGVHLLLEPFTKPERIRVVGRVPSQNPVLLTAEQRWWMDRRRRMLHDRGEVHAHFVIGNVPEDVLRATVDRWPFSRWLEKIKKKRGGVFGALHYALAQTKHKAYHALDTLSHMDHLVEPPRWSDNAEPLLDYRRAVIKRTKLLAQADGALLAASNMTREQRIERGRNAANARWKKGCRMNISYTAPVRTS
jgi:hypothetical protein